jgi:hypothetical protein
MDDAPFSAMQNAQCKMPETALALFGVVVDAPRNWSLEPGASWSLEPGPPKSLSRAGEAR